jgi:hypothetical protein
MRQVLQFIYEFELATCYNLTYICNIWLLNPIYVDKGYIITVGNTHKYT